MCFLRHLSEDECLAALAEAEPFIGRIHGFGLDSSERGHPPSKFARLFARCRALGKPVVAHAGEEAAGLHHRGARHPRRAAHRPRRAGAGRPGGARPPGPRGRAAHRLPAVQHAAVRVCHDGGAQPAAAHRRRRQGDAQQRRPAYFGGYLNDNIRAVQAAFGFDAATWYRLARNSFEASFATRRREGRLDRPAGCVFCGGGVPPG
jgi:adenosine deaminase